MHSRSSRSHLRFCIALVAIVLALFATPIAASEPSSTGGTFGPTRAPAATSVRSADGNRFINIAARPGAFTGTFVGTYSEDLQIIIHKDGSTNFAAQLTCQCTVEGRSGTITIWLNGTGSPAGFEAHWRIVDATGGLAGLHGQGTLSGPVPSTYSGQHHFE